jgi:hypothetical protein
MRRIIGEKGAFHSEKEEEVSWLGFHILKETVRKITHKGINALCCATLID